MSKREKQFHKMYAAEIHQHQMAEVSQNMLIVFFLALIALLSK